MAERSTCTAGGPEAAASGAVPRHVPPELVHACDFGEGLGDWPQETIGRLHRSHRIFYSPVHYSGTDRGAWVLTRAADIRQVLQDAATFSSRGFTGRSEAVGAPLIPVELDPPDHAKFRVLMNPWFSPARMGALEHTIRERAVQLTAEIAPRGSCDFVLDFARRFPAMIFADLMGLPSGEIPRFLSWERDILSSDAERRRAKTKEIISYLQELCAERRARPADDLVSLAVDAKIDGRPISDDEVQGMTFLLFIAGLDTVASSLSFHMRHLAQNESDQARLRSDPSCTPDAVEELLRAYSTVSPSRIATRDVEVAGVQLKAGDLIVCSTIAANRDPKEFTSPETIDLERTPNRHNAFSYGPHRCLGSHLARRELIIAHQEWAQTIPPYRLKRGTPLRLHGGGVLGLESLPLEWN